METVSNSTLVIDEQARRRFEAAWLAGSPQPIEDYLPSPESSFHLATLEELVVIEMEFSWKAWGNNKSGDVPRPPLLETYLDRFPLLRNEAIILRLAKEEFRVRNRYGDYPATEGYRDRFPQAVKSDELLSTKEPSHDTSVTRMLELPGYELMTEVGRGGMGVVYRARDLALNRDVAVKFLQEKFVSSSLAGRRFLDEARITGQLQHPGIPPVHEVGELPDGRPYLVMKLIKGRTLADAIAEGPEERGSLIPVFEQLCQAVGYAHNHGVVHRDLKPQNVMIGAFGEVQVMDWGLAKFRSLVKAKSPEAGTVSTFQDPRAETDGEFDTRTGSFLGTPAYMAPEQAIGAIDQIDERSDVFGLGGILCSILTGKPPFVSDSAESTRQLAATGKLSAAFSRLDSSNAEPELVALSKQCLAVEPSDRPPNAGAVAKAVAAFRQSAEERARQADLDLVRAQGQRAKAEAESREQRKRRRVQLWLALAVGLLLTGAGTFAWWRGEMKGEQARLDGERMAEDAIRAEQEINRLARNTDALTVLVGRCENALKRNDEESAQASLIEIERRVQEGGGEALAGRLARCHEDIAFLRQLDAIDKFLSTPVNDHLPDRRVIVEKWKKGFAASGLDVIKAPTVEIFVRMDTSLLRDRLIGVLDMWLVNEPSSAVRELLGRLDPDPYRDAVRQAISKKNDRRLLELAEQPEALLQPPSFATALGHNEKISDSRRRVLLEVALRSRPGDLALLLALGRICWEGETGSQTSPKRGAESLRWLQAAVAAHPRSSVAHLNLAIVLVATGEVEGAIAAAKEAIKNDPQYPSAHELFGTALMAKGDLEGAIKAYREAVKLEPKFAPAHYNLGNALKAKGNLDGAIEAYRNAINADPTFIRTYNNLGNTLAAKGDVKGAAAAYRDATKADPKFGLAYLNLSLALAAMGDVEGAIGASREAIKFEPRLAFAHACLANALTARGDASKGDLEGAITAFKEAIKLDPKDPRYHNNLGLALMSKGDVKGAIAAYNNAIKSDPSLALAYYNLGNALNANADPDGAITSFKQAIKIDPKYPYAHHELANTLKAQGDVTGAIASYKLAIKLDPRNSVYSYNNLAWLLAVGPDHVCDGKQAVQNATRACELSAWKQPEFIETLAAAYAEAGDFDKAIEFQKKALTFPEIEKRFGTRAQSQLKLYSQRKPYRDPAFVRRELAPQPHVKR